MKRALLIIITAIITTTIYAVQPASKMLNFMQSDGSTITLLLNGDDFRGHSLTTTDGFEIVKDDINEQYYYAFMDETGRLKSTGVKAHNPDSRSNSELEFLKSNSYNKAMRAKTGIIDPNSIVNKTFPSSGNVKLLMVLVNFSDTQITHNQQAFSNMMNQPNYSGIGSFKDYYTEVSGGKLNVTTDVINWVTVSNTHKYYGENVFGSDAARTELILEVIQLIDPVVNFVDYDNDKDGVIDGLCIVHQGKGEEYVGSDPNNIWSSIGDLRKLYNPPYREIKFDGITLGPYSLQPEIEAFNGSAISTVGVFCHEFGHWLGLPDFYDTDYEKSGGNFLGTGDWDLMNTGSWNKTIREGDTPAHHNPYSKNKLGWNSTTKLNSPATIIRMRDATVSNINYRIDTKTKGEYFLLENRQKVSFDAGVYQDGLVIYHVDSAQIEGNTTLNTVNISSNQGMIFERNSWKLSFPLIGTEFSDTSTPNALSKSNVATEKPLTNISLTNRQISFDFMGGMNSEVTNILVENNIFSTSKTIVIKNHGGENYSIFNIAGVLVKQGKINTSEINITLNTSGVYMVLVNDTCHKLFIK